MYSVHDKNPKRFIGFSLFANEGIEVINFRGKMQEGLNDYTSPLPNRYEPVRIFGFPTTEFVARCRLQYESYRQYNSRD